MDSTVTLTLNLTTKKGIVTDSTDYAALGIDVSALTAKALATIKFQGEIIYNQSTVSDPLIDLGAGDTTFEFNLELDSNGEVAYGTYEISGYQVALVDSIYQFFATENNITFDSGNNYSASISEGDTVVVPSGLNAGTFTFTGATAYLSNFLLAVLEEPVVNEGDEGINGTVYLNPTLENTIYVYGGCTQVEAAVSLISDCDYGDFGTWTVANETDITTQTLVSLNCTINYPSWTGEAAIVETSLPYVNNRLATGTYSVTLTEVIRQTESDGLILQYTASVTEEFVVTCAGTLCGMAPCIENLREAHANELSNNRISKYQIYVDNVNLYYLQAVSYKSCSDNDAYQEALANIQATLSASGTDCSACQEENEFRWVANTSDSTITAIEELEAALQYRLYNGIPGATQDESIGVALGAIWQNVNSGIEYRCTDPTAGAAVWEVYYNPNVSAANQSYYVNVSQSTGYDPVVTVFQNNTGATITWARTNTGTYTVTASSTIFTETFVGILVGALKNGEVGSVSWSYEDGDEIIIYTRDETGALKDGMLDETTFHITIWG